MGTLLFSQAMPAMAIEQSFEVQNTVQQTSYAFSYEVNEDGTGITITDLSDDYSGSLTIPSTIDGLPVTSIGDSAFYSCNKLTSITIPDSITSIGFWAFDNCISLTTVAIPDSVTSIAYNAFANCTSLTSINVSINNNYYCSDNGVLYSKDKTKLIIYPVGKPASTLTISDLVTSIGSEAFYCCTNLTTITIPDSVINIGWYAFKGCTNLTSITISDSVTNIDGYAFFGCESLISILIPNNVKKIGDFAFAINYLNQSKVTIYCLGNSYAEDYAKTNNINYVIIGYEEETTGDTNGDGTITAKDSAVVLQCVSQMAQLTAEQIKLADMNGDGVVTAKDSAMILQKIASL